MFIWLKKLLTKIPNTGLILDINPNTAHYDLILAGAKQAGLPTTFFPIPLSLPESFSRIGKMPKHRYQGRWPFCVSCSGGKLCEWFNKQEGIDMELSAVWLAMKSNTTKVGNSMTAVLDVIRNYGIPQERFAPYSLLDSTNDWDELKRASFSISDSVLSDALKYKIKGYMSITGLSNEVIKAAIMKYPLHIAIGLGDTYKQRYGGLVTPPTSYTYYHAILLTGWDKNGNWEVYDSLDVPTYYLRSDYELLAVMAIDDLPNNWKELQNDANASTYPIITTHYGLEASKSLEEKSALALQLALKKLKNPSVYAAAGKWWLVYVNAIAYGGYSVTDCVNDCYNWRRTGKHIFDFNTMR